MKGSKTNLQKQRFSVFLCFFALIFLGGCSGFGDKIKQQSLDLNLQNKKLIFNKEPDIIVEGHPWGITLSPDETMAYVTCSFNDNVVVVDLIKGKVITAIPVGHSPWESALDRRRNRLYVTNGDDGTISILDLSFNEEIAKISSGGILPFGIYYSEENDEIYVLNCESNSLSIICAETLEEKSSLLVGDYPYGLDFDSFNNLLYVSGNFDGNVSIVDVKKPEVIKVIKAGGHIGGLSIDQKHQRTFLAGTETGQIFIINNETRLLEGVYHSPDNPVDVCLDETHRYVYSVHRDLGVLAVFSSHSQGLLAKMEVGKEPIKTVIAPLQNLIITVNHGSDSLSVFKYKVE